MVIYSASDLCSAADKSLQSCPTLCDPIDGSPPGSPVPGILQARTLEWVAISFSDLCSRYLKSRKREQCSSVSTDVAFGKHPAVIIDALED